MRSYKKFGCTDRSASGEILVWLRAWTTLEWPFSYPITFLSDNLYCIYITDADLYFM